MLTHKRNRNPLISRIKTTAPNARLASQTKINNETGIRNMFTAPPLRSHFDFHNSPQRLPERLQRAVYNGRLHAVRKILAESDDECTAGDCNINAYQLCRAVVVYQPLNMNLLHMAVARDHADVAAALLDVWERDFRTLQRWHNEHGVVVDTMKWIRRPVLVACGERRVAEALHLSADIRRTTDAGQMRRTNGRNGLLVLCKRSNMDERPQVGFVCCVIK